MTTYSIRQENDLFRIDLFGLPCRGFRAYATRVEAEAAVGRMEVEDRLRDKEARMFDL